MNRELERAYREWFRSYPFNLYATFTFKETFPRHLRGVFTAARAPIGKTLSLWSREIGSPVAALGLISYSQGGHLHAHLCLWIKQQQTKYSLDKCAGKLDRCWPAVSKTSVIRSKRDVTNYIASADHLFHAREFDFFEHGPNLLSAIRQSST